MSDLRARLAAGETVVGSFVSLGSALTAEIMGLAGFDWLVVDLEHGAGDEQAMTGQLQALAHTGATALVRVEAIDQIRVLHALDAGADGILVPRLRSAEDAALAVSYCRYAEGRGVAHSTRAWRWGLRSGTHDEMDRSIFCAVQIETAEALAAAAEIAAVDGVDVLFIGPADLSNSLGLDCAFDDPQMLAHGASVVAAAREHGKAAGILVGSPAQAAGYRELGFTFVGVGTDGVVLAAAAARLAADLQALR